MIYFIQAGNDGPIKIGKAQNPEARRRELQTGNHKKLKLITEIPGDKEREDSIHNDLQDHQYRAGSEWFKATRHALRPTDYRLSSTEVLRNSICVTYISDSEFLYFIS